MDWIREHWLWLAALAVMIVVYVHMRMRRSRPRCRELTGVECALDNSRQHANQKTAHKGAGDHEVHAPRTR